MTYKGTPSALDHGPQLAEGGPAWDRVRIRAPDTSKELSFLQEASYVSQEDSIRRLHMGR